jgi:hypothetical protein
MKLHANARLSVKGRELLVVVLCKRLVKAVDDRSFHAKAHADAQNRDCPCQGSGAIVSGTAANKATEAALAAYRGGRRPCCEAEQRRVRGSQPRHQVRHISVNQEFRVVGAN